MGRNYIWIAFFVLTKLGYSQVNPSDTINYKENIFRIVLPTKYNSNLIPKIEKNQIILVDKATDKEQNIRIYTVGVMRDKKYSEYIIKGASLELAFDAFITKDVSTFWITGIDDSDDSGNKRKPIIPGFKMERIK